MLFSLFLFLVLGSADAQISLGRNETSTVSTAVSFSSGPTTTEIISTTATEITTQIPLTATATATATETYNVSSPTIMTLASDSEKKILNQGKDPSTDTKKSKSDEPVSVGKITTIGAASICLILGISFFLYSTKKRLFKSKSPPPLEIKEISKVVQGVFVMGGKNEKDLENGDHDSPACNNSSTNFTGSERTFSQSSQHSLSSQNEEQDQDTVSELDPVDLIDIALNQETHNPYNPNRFSYSNDQDFEAVIYSRNRNSFFCDQRIKNLIAADNRRSAIYGASGTKNALQANRNSVIYESNRNSIIYQGNRNSVIFGAAHFKNGQVRNESWP